MTEQAALPAALAWIRKAEGGYASHPDDPGGETKFGISKAAYPELDIGALTWEQATGIYARDYWYPANCDELPLMLAVAVFDGAVNHGRAQDGGWDAVRFLQQAAGVYVDGLNGPVTQQAAHAADPEDLLVRYLGYRAQYYQDLIIEDPALAAFYLGWMNRLFRLQRYCLIGRRGRAV